MSLGKEQPVAKKAKELKSELKQLKKDLLSAGCEKNSVNIYIKEFWEAIELGDSLQTEYEYSRACLKSAREAIPKILDCMGVSPETEVSESLISLVRSLDRVYHECSIRADDLDFQSTMKSLKQMTDAKGKGSLAGASGMSEIMLRSELENIKAVLDDAAGWNPPDFLALAYYFAHEERDTVRDMESGQRNTYVLNYFNEHFMNQFLAAADHAGQKEQVLTLIQEYVYGE